MTAKRRRAAKKAAPLLTQAEFQAFAHDFHARLNLLAEGLTAATRVVVDLQTRVCEQAFENVRLRGSVDQLVANTRQFLTKVIDVSREVSVMRDRLEIAEASLARKKK